MRMQVSTTAILAWRKLAGAPTVPDYDQWVAFRDEQELGIVGNRVDKGREELLKENLVKKNRLLDLEIAEKERKSVDRNAVNQMLLRMGSLIKTVSFQRLEHEMPAKALGMGAPVEDMRRLGRETAEALCEVFAQEMDKWGAG